MAHRTHRTIGEPDFVILADNGRTFLIECKVHGNKLTTQQAALAAWARRLGHTYACVHSVEEFLTVANG